MDKRLSGRFYFDDLVDFGEIYHAQASATRGYDLQVITHTRELAKNRLLSNMSENSQVGQKIHK